MGVSKLMEISLLSVTQYKLAKVDTTEQQHMTSTARVGISLPVQNNCQKTCARRKKKLINWETFVYGCHDDFSFIKPNQIYTDCHTMF